jgi:hypothetical protein
MKSTVLSSKLRTLVRVEKVIVVAMLFGILVGVAAAQDAQGCAETSDFQICKDGFTNLVFPNNDTVEIYQDHLVFVATGVIYRFDSQLSPSDARDSALHCISVPASSYERIKKVRDNWRMKNSTDYWECLMDQQRALEIQLSLLKRHKDLRHSLYNNFRYSKAVVEYLANHFGDARFDVYSLAQQEQAYQALHSQKWD